MRNITFPPDFYYNLRRVNYQKLSSSVAEMLDMCPREFSMKYDSVLVLIELGIIAPLCKLELSAQDLESAIEVWEATLQHSSSRISKTSDINKETKADLASFLQKIDTEELARVLQMELGRASARVSEFIAVHPAFEGSYIAPVVERLYVEPFMDRRAQL